uniref:Uncharacterized protein n=1 Tax=Knipowitschia caucasica TaxID=637954 RepID=A0AAV2JQI8_KNICA
MQKAADAAEMETNSMRRALLKKYNEQTQQREKMEQLQNHIIVMQKDVTVNKRDKEAADESKKALMVTISEGEDNVKAKNEELVAVAAQVKAVEHRVRQKTREVAVINN